MVVDKDECEHFTVFAGLWITSEAKEDTGMTDIPNTRFINFVDNPAAIQYSQYGEAQVNLDPPTGGILDIREFRRVSIHIGSTNASSFWVSMGKISGATLSQGYTQPLDGNTHTFEIVGPELALWLLGGAPNSQEQVQLWVYLRS